GGQASLDQVLTLCRSFRRRGIASFFLEAAVTSLNVDLYRSAGAFAKFLESAEEDMKATSKSEPFFDAVAARDLETAGGIAQRSRQTWNEDEEYEEDFLYVLLLMQKYFLEEGSAGFGSSLQRREELAAPADEPRAAVIRSLIEKDS